MSFWSFIGLAGKKEFLELQSNVSSLIEENRLLREDNKRLFQLITDVNDTTHRELEELISLYNTKYDDTVNSISNYQQRVFDSISKLDKEVKGICDEMQKLLGLNTGKIVENIHSAQELCIANIKSILEKINNMDSSVMADLEEMREQDEKTVQYILKIKEILNDNAESVQNLWMIMKLVWVDSLISDIDSLT